MIDMPKDIWLYRDPDGLDPNWYGAPDHRPEIAAASMETRYIQADAETTADRLLRHILAENPVLKLPQGMPDDELELLKEAIG